jgi:competence protein ComEC
MKKLTIHSVPAFIVAAIVAVGILVGRKTGLPFHVHVVLTASVFVLSLFLLSYSHRHSRFFSFLTLSLVVLILSVGATAIQFDALTAPTYQVQSNSVIEVRGKIVEPATRTGNKTRFILRSESVNDLSGPHEMPANVLVTVVRRKHDSLDLPFFYGSRVQLRGQLARPSSERNPGEFDARRYYEAQGIAFVMRVRGYENVSLLDSVATENIFELFMKSIVIPTRSYILALIDQTIGGEEGELLKGIYIGERAGIPFATRTAFTNSGISHILAVSGSNVVIVLWFFSLLFALLRLPRIAKSIATLLAVLFYMLLTGSQPPIVRATVMACVFQLGKLFGEKPNGLNSLGVSALIILGYDARQMFDVGFQLSFAAVLSLVYLFPIVKEWMPHVYKTNLWARLLNHSLELAVATFVVTVGTLPMIAVYFGKVSVVGLVANILIVPMVGMSVVLGFVSSLVGWLSLFIADAYSAVNGIVLGLTLWIAKLSGGLSWAYVDTLQFRPIHAIPFYAAAGILFHSYSKSAVRKFALWFIASLNLVLVVPPTSVERSSQGKLRVSFIDVGQGDAALVEFPHGKTMLIDAGAASEDYDAGERIVTPFLKRRGITTIDYLVASHAHSDHIGGFPYIFKTFSVSNVIESGQSGQDSIYAEYAEAIRSERCNVDTARAGDFAIEIDNVTLYALHPFSKFVDPDTTHAHENINNTSVVFKLCYGDQSFLFMGDAEHDAEADMGRVYGDFLQSTILKTGHHGSITSTSQQFLDLVKPEYAVVSVGMNNTFNHPSEEVLQRLKRLNVETLRTDEEGAVIFETDGRRLERIEWRDY